MWSGERVYVSSSYWDTSTGMGFHQTILPERPNFRTGNAVHDEVRQGMIVEKRAKDQATVVSMWIYDG